MENRIMLMAHSPTLWLSIVIGPFLLGGLIYLFVNKELRSKTKKTLFALWPFSKKTTASGIGHGAHQNSTPHGTAHPTPKPHEEHHHGPSWFVRFFCIIFAIVGTLYLITKWWPKTWAGVKDSYNAFMSDNTEETSTRSHPRKYFTDMVTVTSAGFSPFRLINEKIECTVESGSVKIYVSEWDGSNEHVYNTDGKDHDLQTPHHYRFVAKPGTTAVVSYTITPAQ